LGPRRADLDLDPDVDRDVDGDQDPAVGAVA
jgi:hypothetical protein